MPDVRGEPLYVGAHVATALREGNVAALRVGVVQELSYAPEPQVEGRADLPPEEVAKVYWTFSTNSYLPKKSTWVASRKLVLVSDQSA